jgi:hypothetical protein
VFLITQLHSGVLNYAPRVLSCPTCSQLPYVFSIAQHVLSYPRVLNYHACSPTCSQFPYVFSVSHVFSIPLMCIITSCVLNCPHVFSIVSHVLNYHTCFQLHHVFLITQLHAGVLNYTPVIFVALTCSQLPHVFSIAQHVLSYPVS